ncbi:MAG: SDR family oxidoreductase [Candidatus Devosia phytovorans]|uniref:NADP-dependent 3-hydroxy acid dehydrogenase YdfG n=1 Tax=Candidatus Devosia phytovorans TaxID=3121372 RepID=A0AAJ5VVH2_9HYPH|nr:SDR family oxidoreductase [Devosia sp.]WEK05127.1 MAG: SDR family oxidoreductase [Devosia sp.]
MSSSKTALITGASSGIGAVYARRLAARGYNLVLVARRADRLAELATELAETGKITVETVTADLTADADIARIEQLLREQSIDLLINNAGMGPAASTADMSDADAAATLALNVTALMRLTRAALPGMRARKSGTVVNVGSVLAFHALPQSTLYSATKAFVLTFSRGVAEEVKDDGVLVQAVLPAGTITEFYEAAGMFIADFDQSVFMTAEQLVDAGLAGMDRGEQVTLPSVHDEKLWTSYDAARAQLMGGTQNGSPAQRYTQA